MRTLNNTVCRRAPRIRLALLWCGLVLVMTPASVASAGVRAAKTAAQWESDGRSLFSELEFKLAAHCFELALAQEPHNAAASYWLGKSYARMADVSTPLFAPRTARRARRYLEQAVALDPRNQEYLLELFDFYLDSPEWFRGGIERAAALLERIDSLDPGADPELRRRLADSRGDHSGASWGMRRVILLQSQAIGELFALGLR